MSAIWYAILALMLAVYIALDGRNFGAGILHFLVAKSAPERRQIVAAIGPLWTWHEVWLIGAGGVMLLAFPSFMASAFSGYYLALFLVLWCVLLRGISLEVGGHLADPLWQAFWDFVFSLGNVLLAVLFGAAFGNVIRGAPISRDGTFHLPFFTDFGVRGDVGLLDWYTLSVAVFAVLILTAHGATFLTLRNSGPVHDRARSLSKKLWLAAIPGFLIISALTWIVRPELIAQMPARPLAWITLAISFASAGALFTGLKQDREKLALAGSSVLIAGLILTGAATLFPVLMYSTIDPSHTLLAQACAAPEHGLKIALFWWTPALALSLTYAWLVQRHYAEKVGP